MRGFRGTRVEKMIETLKCSSPTSELNLLTKLDENHSWKLF
jgi:hypothetical protein